MWPKGSLARVSYGFPRTRLLVAACLDTLAPRSTHTHTHTHTHAHAHLTDGSSLPAQRERQFKRVRVHHTRPHESISARKTTATAAQHSVATATACTSAVA